MIEIVICTMICITLLIISYLKYLSNTICKHKYELHETISAYNGYTKNKLPTHFNYILKCTKCGCITTRKSNDN